MNYKVLDYFTDLQDKNHEYFEGDTYPRKGLKVTAARINELATDENVRGVPVIQVVEETSEVETKPESGKGTNKK